jgi:serine/threonine protein kinase
LREVSALNLLHTLHVPGIVPYHGVVNQSIKLTRFNGDICNLQLNVLSLKMLLYQLLTTLSHMDMIGIVHCDIKPSNILYRTVDGFIEFVLCDFGLSHFYKNEIIVFNRHIQSGLYKCPELDVANIGVDPRKIDIWSLGMTIASFDSYEDDPELFDMLSLMLTYDPKQRPTASELLKSSMFNDFRLIYPVAKNIKVPLNDTNPDCADFLMYIENMGLNALSIKLALNIYLHYINNGQQPSEHAQQNIINIATLLFEDIAFFDINETAIMNIVENIGYNPYSFVTG